MYSPQGSSTDTASPAHIVYSHCSCRGLRPTMEDEVACRLDVAGIPGTGFFGVFDGHGMSDMSRFIHPFIFVIWSVVIMHSIRKIFFSCIVDAV